jgi:hypothetical protein
VPNPDEDLVPGSGDHRDGNEHRRRDRARRHRSPRCGGPPLRPEGLCVERPAPGQRLGHRGEHRHRGRDHDPDRMRRLRLREYDVAAWRGDWPRVYRWMADAQPEYRSTTPIRPGPPTR